MCAAQLWLTASRNMLPPWKTSLQRTRVTCRLAIATEGVVEKQATRDSLVMLKPDDWHLHVRDGAALNSVVLYSARHFKRAIIMPNLKPPVTTVQQALDYRERVSAAIPADCDFQPLMTLYLTDTTTPEDVRAAKAAGIIAYKLYPAGATTNSQSGVTDIAKCMPTLAAMAQENVLLLVHGEVTDSHIDMFDREKEFIHRILAPLVEQLPHLRVVMEHITTKEATEFVASAPQNVAASITPQHIIFNRNALFQGGLRPHSFCLPILKREEHRKAVLAAAVSGDPRFFLGTDSAPHAKGDKESACGCAGIFSSPVALALYAQAFESVDALDKLEGFASCHGPDFYGLPRNTEKIRLIRRPWTVPDTLEYGEQVIVPMWAGRKLEWTVDPS